MNFRLINSALVAAIGFTAFAGSAAHAQGETIFALDTDNELFIFNSLNPTLASRVGTGAITGLNAGQSIQSIDVRVTTSLLFGLSTDNIIYTINTNTGAATLFSTAFSGGPLSQYVIDFNPVPNALRIIGTTAPSSNFRITNTDGNNLATLNTDQSYPAGFTVTGTAYNNNDTNPGTGTVQFVVRDEDDSLYTLPAPNSPTTTPPVNVGALGVAVSGIAEIDISSVTGLGYLGNGTNFYNLNVSTATGVTPRATLVGSITSITPGATFNGVRGISVSAAPEPGTVALLGLGLLGGMGILRRRRK